MMRSRVCGLVGWCLVAWVWLAPAWRQALDPTQARREEAAGIDWYDLKKLPVEGRGWTETAAFYDRLPAKAEALVRKDVWNLSRHSAGLCVRFTTASPAIHCRWTVTATNLAMPHMPATGVSGVDLYVKHQGTWRWLACGFPREQTNQAALVSGLPAEEREYLLYLPIYNGVSEVELGVARGATVAAALGYGAGKEKPIVFYGTSITHGACASRPGMPHPAILGRRLDRPVINLGFSGNGRMEPEVGRFIAEIDAAVFVIDCLPNITAAEVTARTQPLVKLLREARPQTPIVLVEDRSYSGSWLISSQAERNQSSRKALKEQYEMLLQGGVERLFYVDGESLLGNDRDDTTDGSHPSDLGFFRHAEALEPVLRKALG